MAQELMIAARTGDWPAPQGFMKQEVLRLVG